MMSTSEGEAVKVEGGHVSVTTISMSGPETSNGKINYLVTAYILYFLAYHFAKYTAHHITDYTNIIKAKVM